jgi:radical SAM protein with 4Fe4S-binding SPASM domain
LGNRVLSLSGGEPTLRADWHLIAREAVKCGIAVNLVTNGQGDPTRLAELAHQCGLANVGVSLDGLETTHDAIRRPGAFARATQMIRGLAESGIGVDVMHTVTRASLGELASLCNVAHRLGARALRVQLAKPMGKLHQRDPLLLRPADLLQLMPALGELAVHAAIEVRVGDSVGFYSPQEKWLRKRASPDGLWGGCRAGLFAAGIQSDGSVKGCLSLQPRFGEDDVFVEGNLREESLATIWHRRDAFAYNRAFDASSLSGSCGRCSHARMCRGGARCVAYAVGGDLSCDPMCYAAVATQTLGAKALLRPVVPIASTLLMLTACTTQTDYGIEGPVGAGGSPSDAAADTSQAGSAGFDGGADALGLDDSAAQAETDSNADAIDCARVCCECDYGIIPPEVAEACCSRPDGSRMD